LVIVSGVFPQRINYNVSSVRFSPRFLSWLALTFIYFDRQTEEEPWSYELVVPAQVVSEVKKRFDLSKFSILTFLRNKLTDF
jgi:hypothetical protein